MPAVPSDAMPSFDQSVAIVTADEMRAAEAAAIASGISAAELMERAGAAAALAVESFAGPMPVLVLCGPGNNGGDGYVIARLLRERGWPVRVAALAPPRADPARAAASRWHGPVEHIGDATKPAAMLVDALFGIGLSKPVGDPTMLTVHRLAQAARIRVGIDLPTGVSTDDGALLSLPIDCDLTVTFGAPKPAHVLHPAAAYVGRIVVAAIGTDHAAVIRTIGRPSLPSVAPAVHKFERGHALVVSGPMHATGAARLAARAALRAGAGYVSLLSDGRALAANAAHLTGVVLRRADTPEALAAAFADARANVLAIGPALGMEGGRDKVLAALSLAKPVVLDADVFSLFADDPDVLFAAIHGPAVMTPHEGEFARLFGTLAGSKIDRAREAARRAGAVLLLKGPDTVIAAPDGRVGIASHAVPALATAGSGDVLTGIIAGLVARGMTVFDAACAATWIHAQAGRLLGPGLVAEDLPEALPRVLAMLS